jgi:hypothetical protein
VLSDGLSFRASRNTLRWAADHACHFLRSPLPLSGDRVYLRWSSDDGGVDLGCRVTDLLTGQGSVQHRESPEGRLMLLTEHLKAEGYP